jgi:hypothetical protein
MNSLPDMIRDYKPVTYLSVDIDRLVLKSALRLSLSEAVILSLLLREYQAGTFPVKAVRQHIHNIRKKLAARYGMDTISSVGMGFYAIPEAVKASIKQDFAGE